MIICKTRKQLKKYIEEQKFRNKSIGFVPTMGALHPGHVSLVKSAKAQTDSVVCSIFVNPTQFNNLSDLEKYPRTLESDCLLLKAAGCDAVFVPEIEEMYSEQELELKKQGVEDQSWAEGKTIDFGGLARVMEGEFRPGHFNGVAQVVSKLFKFVEPNKAFFGEKDFQQLAIIRSMVKQMDFLIEIVACPTLREPNGLAMSSRNERLTKEQRERASLISKTLFAVKELASTKTVVELKAFAENQIKSEPQMKLEYFEIADVETLQPVLELKKNKEAVACIALQLGDVRLIDNVILTK